MMRISVTHRAIAVVSSCALALVALGACKPASDTFAADLAQMETDIAGIIGVYAENIATGKTLAHRADERFAFASTFKPLLVAAALANVDAGLLSLEQRVSLDGIEIQPHSPVINALRPGQLPSIDTLCEAAITISDNTATNLLLELVGGPESFTSFLRAHGDDVSRLDRYEIALNSNLAGDPRDTSTPRAMSASYAHFVFGSALSTDSRQRLKDWLLASKTGAKRLRAGLPADWVIGDKTGHGANGAVNNIAVAWPPNSGPIVITVFMSGTNKDVATLNAVHARIAALVSSQLAGG